jgi:hypothetical protein
MKLQNTHLFKRVNWNVDQEWVLLIQALQNISSFETYAFLIETAERNVDQEWVLLIQTLQNISISKLRRS